MFTGLVQCVGRVGRIASLGGDRRFLIEVAEPGLDRVAVGDSIAVDGCCLTAVTAGGGAFEADVSNESLSRTTLGELDVGSRVNLETALTLSTPLGGHLVSGHVDGVGEVLARRPDGCSERWRFRAPAELARYIAEKGSICVNGISLTVNVVDGAAFDVNVVPHTAAATNLGDLGPGARVNLEVDLVARYLERLLQGRGATGGGVDEALLARAGFLKR